MALELDQMFAIMAASIFAGYCAHSDNPKTDEELYAAMRQAVVDARLI